MFGEEEWIVVEGGWKVTGEECRQEGMNSGWQVMIDGWERINYG